MYLTCLVIEKRELDNKQSPIGTTIGGSFHTYVFLDEAHLSKARKYPYLEAW